MCLDVRIWQQLNEKSQQHTANSFCSLTCIFCNNILFFFRRIYKNSRATRAHSHRVAPPISNLPSSPHHNWDLWHSLFFSFFFVPIFSTTLLWTRSSLCYHKHTVFLEFRVFFRLHVVFYFYWVRLKLYTPYWDMGLNYNWMRGTRPVLYKSSLLCKYIVKCGVFVCVCVK